MEIRAKYVRLSDEHIREPCHADRTRPLAYPARFWAPAAPRVTALLEAKGTSEQSIFTDAFFPWG